MKVARWVIRSARHDVVRLAASRYTREVGLGEVVDVLGHEIPRTGGDGIRENLPVGTFRGLEPIPHPAGRREPGAVPGADGARLGLSIPQVSFGLGLGSTRRGNRWAHRRS